MAKQFYTEHDIEDMFKRGVQSLEVGSDVVLTELAYERANRLGMKLVQGSDAPPSAPVRPYITKESQQKAGVTGTYATYAAAPAAAGGDLHKRVRDAVIARLGTQVDGNLLDSIISRSLKAVGLK